MLWLWALALAWAMDYDFNLLVWALGVSVQYAFCVFASGLLQVEFSVFLQW